MTDNLDIDAHANVAAESFGSNLERMRKARGWTQSKLGDLSNVHMISVCRYESGDRPPNFRALVSLAAAFGVTVDELIKP